MRRVIAAVVVALAGFATAAPIPTLDSRVESMTTAAERRAFIAKHQHETIEGRLGGKLTTETEEPWTGAWWAAQIMQVRSPLVLKALKRALDSWPERSEEFRRATLQAAYALYPTELVPEMRRVLAQENSEKRFAMAAYYLLRAEPTDKTRRRIEKELRRFPEAGTHPILRALKRRLEPPAATVRPPLADLLGQPLAPAGPVLFSFQRPDRRQPGLAMVRRTDGKFLRQPDGTLFAVPQLAMAISNLPGTITNGNTPQGIHSIVGTDVSTNVFMGKTPFLWTRLPFEVPPADYFHGTHSETKWNSGLYVSMLPPSWRSDPGMQEAWDAGEAGRSEILTHGTTIDPEFYRGETYYPHTPSMGCLCALELWSPETGKAISSDQIALLKAWETAGGGKGYAVVVELENVARPVGLDDVRMALMEAEGK